MESYPARSTVCPSWVQLMLSPCPIMPARSRDDWRGQLMLSPSPMMPARSRDDWRGQLMLSPCPMMPARSRDDWLGQPTLRPHMADCNGVHHRLRWNCVSQYHQKLEHECSIPLAPVESPETWHQHATLELDNLQNTQYCGHKNRQLAYWTGKPQYLAILDPRSRHLRRDKNHGFENRRQRMALSEYPTVDQRWTHCLFDLLRQRPRNAHRFERQMSLLTVPLAPLQTELRQIDFQQHYEMCWVPFAQRQE